MASSVRELFALAVYAVKFSAYAAGITFSTHSKIESHEKIQPVVIVRRHYDSFIQVHIVEEPFVTK